MASKIDPAILKALSVDAANATITSHGGSGFSSTFKLATKDADGKEKRYFVKTGKGKGSEVMFAGEHTSLNALHSAVPSLCPPSQAHGRLSSSSGSFLITTFLHPSLSSSSSSSVTKPPSGLSLAQKLATLHSTPVPIPIPSDYKEPQFSFPLPTCCGDTQQDNTYHSSWADFFANCRLRHILGLAEKNHGSDSELCSLVNKTISVIVPRLLSPTHLKSLSGEPIKPVLVHGDLWAGNHGLAIIDGEEGGMEEVIFDPSSTYAHSEYEFGIMRMFGGFGPGFEREYHVLKGKDDPVGEWEDRVGLYEYHHLNHYSIFGGGYKDSAMRIMRGLLYKYGDEN